MLQAYLISFLAVIGIGGIIPMVEIFKQYFQDLKDQPKFTNVYYKITLPVVNETSIEEMEMFFTSIVAIKRKQAKSQITFEVHSDGGELSFYLVTHDTVFSLVRSSLENRFPGTNFTEVPDPLANMQDTFVYNNPKSEFKDFRGADIGHSLREIDGVKVNQDLMPSLSWRAIQNGNQAPTNDPISQLFNAMQEAKDHEYAVFQLIIKPMDPKREDWKKEFNAVRTQLSTNAKIDTSSSLTEEEKKILNEINRKINAECFSCKIRFGWYTRDLEIASNIDWEIVPLTFLQQFRTPYQFFSINSPYEGSNTGIKYLNKVEVKKVSKDIFESKVTIKESDIEGAFKKIMNNNHGVEATLRKKQLHVALLKRALEDCSAPNFIDAESLACIFHFPTTTDKPNISSRLQGLANQSVDTVASNWATPPTNLPF